MVLVHVRRQKAELDFPFVVCSVSFILCLFSPFRGDMAGKLKLELTYQGHAHAGASYLSLRIAGLKQPSYRPHQTTTNT